MSSTAEATGEILSANLMAAAVKVDLVDVERFLVREYDVVGSTRQLSGERDLIFHIQSLAGPEYVLKVAHPSEARIVTNFQTKALLHIAAVAPTLPIQRTFPARDGKWEVPMVGADGDGLGIARLLSFIPGEILRLAPRSVMQRRNLGRVGALLGQALFDFDHPASRHEFSWDIKLAGRLRSLVPSIPGDAASRALVLQCLNVFDERVAPVLPVLRSQVVHNDLNRNNVVVDPADPDRIVAVLDFGDMVHTALVNDVAIGAANQLSETDDPFADAVDFVAGYHETLPLTRQEIDLLPDLVTTRLVMSVVITEWRAAKFPHKREHIRRNTPANWARLARLVAGGRDPLIRALRRACGME